MYVWSQGWNHDKNVRTARHMLEQRFRNCSVTSDQFGSSVLWCKTTYTYSGSVPEARPAAELWPAVPLVVAAETRRARKPTRNKEEQLLPRLPLVQPSVTCWSRLLCVGSRQGQPRPRPAACKGKKGQVMIRHLPRLSTGRWSAGTLQLADAAAAGFRTF